MGSKQDIKMSLSFGSISGQALTGVAKVILQGTRFEAQIIAEVFISVCEYEVKQQYKKPLRNILKTYRSS